MKTGMVYDQPVTIPLEQVRARFDAMGSFPWHDSAHTRAVGVHLEGVREMLATLRDAAASPSAQQTFSLVVDVLTFVQRKLKEDTLPVSRGEIDRTALLDALCDQIVTAIGIAETAGLDIARALREARKPNIFKVEVDV